MIRKSHLLLALAAVLILSLTLCGCPKKQPASPAGTGAGKTGETPKTGGPEKGGPTGETAKTNEPEKAGPTGVGGLPTVTLTADNVKNWVATTSDKKIKDIFDKIKPKEEKGKDEYAQAKQAIEKAADNADLDAAVKTHGFKDAKEWAAVTLKVFAGLMPLMMDEMASKMGPAERNSPEYQKMKTEMDTQMKKWTAAFGELSAEEKQLLKSALPEIQKAMTPPSEGKTSSGG